APSPDGAAAPGSSRGTWRGHAACWRSAGRFRACPSGVISSVRTPISLKGATMPAVLAPPASTVVTLPGPAWDDASQEPTPASVWRAAAGTTIGDELLEWPPDLFALT